MDSTWSLSLLPIDFLHHTPHVLTRARVQTRNVDVPVDRSFFGPQCCWAQVLATVIPCGFAVIRNSGIWCAWRSAVAALACNTLDRKRGYAPTKLRDRVYSLGCSRCNDLQAKDSIATKPNGR